MKVKKDTTPEADFVARLELQRASSRALVEQRVRDLTPAHRAAASRRWGDDRQLAEAGLAELEQHQSWQGGQ